MKIVISLHKNRHKNKKDLPWEATIHRDGEFVCACRSTNEEIELRMWQQIADLAKEAIFEIKCEMGKVSLNDAMNMVRR